MHKESRSRSRRRRLYASILGMVVWGASCSVYAAPDNRCEFGQFPAQPYTGKTAPLKLDSEFSVTFRTRLAEGLREEPNFAGSLSLVTWGCGSNCIDGGVVDHATGRAAPLPFVLFKNPFGSPDELPSPLLYRPDSRLLVATGTFAEGEEQTSTRCYQWTNAALQPVRRCRCEAIPLADLSLDRVQREVEACGAKHNDEAGFSACLLAASRKDIESFKAAVEQVGGTWQMKMSPDDAKLVNHFLHTSAIMYKLPPDADRSIFGAELNEWMDGTMWLVDHREKLRRDPNVFLRTQAAPPQPSR